MTHIIRVETEFVVASATVQRLIGENMGSTSVTLSLVTLVS